MSDCCVSYRAAIPFSDLTINACSDIGVEGWFDGEQRHRALLEVLNAEENNKAFSALEIRHKSQKKGEYTTSSIVGGGLIS